jgi:hypothetical protein
MASSSLVFICLSAFIAVFVLLTVLAVVMRLILLTFPEKEKMLDAAIIAALTTTMQTVYPGTTIKNIEEVK